MYIRKTKQSELSFILYRAKKEFNSFHGTPWYSKFFYAFQSPPTVIFSLIYATLLAVFISFACIQDPWWKYNYISPGCWFYCKLVCIHCGISLDTGFQLFFIALGLIASPCLCLGGIAKVCNCDSQWYYYNPVHFYSQ